MSVSSRSTVIWRCWPVAALLLIGAIVAWRPAGAAPAIAAVLEPFAAVLVLPDDGRQPFIDEIDAADSSIDLYLYLLSDEEIIQGLIRSHVRGVNVRVMLEPEPFGGAQTELETWQRLDAAGIDVRWSPARFRFAHIKLMIVDREVALIMNLNMTESAFEGNRELAVMTSEPAAVAHAAMIFENDWNGRPDAVSGPLISSPETSRSALLALIESAKESLELYAEFITDSEVLEALAAAVERGVLVRLVMSEAAGESLWSEEPGFLARAGVDVRIVDVPYIHAKLVLSDGAVAWIGSQNFTATSLDDNRELGIVLGQPANLARIAAAFEADFLAATPLGPQ
jgi:phosphatidylserine/phosphatidylglycerophosphate/cardiolipin synthase-like enzyme